MADVDPLTGLLSRGAFDAALALNARETTADFPVSLIMVDIDHFKRVNDSHGHQAGDLVLKHVATLMQRVVQQKGDIYRYGGEEFVVILPNFACEEALAVAERARLAIERSPVSGRSVTSSFGVAVAPEHATSPEQLLRRADEALYDAKHRGRNIVRFSGEPAPAAAAPKERKSVRKAPEAGTISDDMKEQLRKVILRSGRALCPVCEDDMPLSAHDVTTQQDLGKSFLVHCPGCGFDANLPSPRR